MYLTVSSYFLISFVMGGGGGGRQFGNVTLLIADILQHNIYFPPFQHSHVYSIIFYYYLLSILPLFLGSLHAFCHFFLLFQFFQLDRSVFYLIMFHLPDL